MANYNKSLSDDKLTVRIGEVRFGYCNVFTPKHKDDGSPDKYSVQILIPKTDKAAKKLIDDAEQAAMKLGISTKWNGKKPFSVKTPLRDGDEEFPEDENYSGMWFLNASTGTAYPPKVMVLEDGQQREALDREDFYSGCWGCAVLRFFPYAASGNNGVTAGLNMLIKTKDDTNLAGGGMTTDTAFGDLTADYLN